MHSYVFDPIGVDSVLCKVYCVLYMCKVNVYIGCTYVVNVSVHAQYIAWCRVKGVVWYDASNGWVWGCGYLRLNL